MAPIPIDQKVRVSYVPTIASIAAPTTTELNAGTTMENWITPDGLDISNKTAAVDTSNLGSKFNSTQPGRVDTDIKVTFHHQTPTDSPWNLLPYGTAWYMVVRRNIDKATAWTAGQQVEVYPCVAGEPNQISPKANTTSQFDSMQFVSDSPNTRAVVAA